MPKPLSPHQSRNLWHFFRVWIRCPHPFLGHIFCSCFPGAFCHLWGCCSGQIFPFQSSQCPLSQGHGWVVSHFRWFALWLLPHCEPVLEITVHNGFVDHYFLLLLSGQKSRIFLKSFCVMQPKFRMDVSGKLQWHRPQGMVWATGLDLKPGSPHLPCHWHLHMQIKASATVSMQAAAALQKNRRGDMTKQVKSLATCGQQHEYNYYSVLHSWTDNLANFSNSSKKAETSLTAESVEKDHNLLSSLYCFISCQYSETSHVSITVS